VARKPDIGRAKDAARKAVAASLRHYNGLRGGNNFLLSRWVAEMAAVELHSAWENYAETRLVSALCHNPQHFLEENGILGVRNVSKGLAKALIRRGGYFDFRSTGDLIKTANRFLDPKDNPFQGLNKQEQDLLDFLATVRNCVVHRSDFAGAKYRRHVARVYRMKKIPEPGEFLNAVDKVPGYFVPKTPRVCGLGFAVLMAIQHS
jgi:hypothetical protein